MWQNTSTDYRSKTWGLQLLQLLIVVVFYIMTTKVASVSLPCKSRRSKATNIKILFTNSTH